MDPFTLMFASAVIGGTGNLLQGFSAKRASEKQAAIMRQQAQDIMTKASFDIDAAERSFRRVQGSNVARAAGSGISMASFYDVLADDAQQAGREQYRISYNAQVQANAVLRGADLVEQQGNDKMLGSVFGAAGSVVNAYAPSFKGAGRGVSITPGGYGGSNPALSDAARLGE
jgi:hypothetical protein